MIPIHPLLDIQRARAAWTRVLALLSKDKAFAKGVNREDIKIGVSELEIDLEQHVSNTIAAMRMRASALGLGLKPVSP